MLPFSTQPFVARSRIIFAVREFKQNNAASCESQQRVWPAAAERRNWVSAVLRVDAARDALLPRMRTSVGWRPSRIHRDYAFSERDGPLAARYFSCVPTAASRADCESGKLELSTK